MLTPSVRYLSQRDNINPWTRKIDAHNQCMVSSFVMLVNWIGDKYEQLFLKEYTERLHLELVGLNPKNLESRRYDSNNHAFVVNRLLSATEITKRLKSCMIKYSELDNIQKKFQCPVIVGSLITSAGHILVYCGDDEWNDPYGKCSEVTKRYFGEGFSFNGEKVKYSSDFCSSNIFRKQSRKCWVLE